MKIDYPIIKTFKTEETFSYLWLKYVTGFNLEQHCARCLLGEYSSAFQFGRQTTALHNEELNEHAARYYYLCGVTKPYRWIKNLHVAFEYAEGEALEYKDDKTYILIENARQIPIVAQKQYMTSHGENPSYNTCRNWRFAYQMTYGYKNK